MTGRRQIHGRWTRPPVCGRFVFSAGPHDDYLELDCENGLLPPPSARADSPLVASIAFEEFAEGRGLGVLRLIDSHTRLGEAAAADRLRDLGRQLAARLPGLRFISCGDSRQSAEGIRADASLAEAATVSTAAQANRPSAEPFASEGETTEPPQGPAGRLTAHAVAELEQGHLKRALRMAHEAVAAGEPGASELLEALKAVRTAATAVRRQPRDARAHLALAWRYFVANAGESAYREATNALRLNPRLGEAHALLGFEHHFRGESSAARTASENATALLPASNGLLRTLADVLAGKGQRLERGSVGRIARHDRQDPTPR